MKVVVFGGGCGCLRTAEHDATPGPLEMFGPRRSTVNWGSIEYAGQSA